MVVVGTLYLDNVVFVLFGGFLLMVDDMVEGLYVE